MIEDKLKSKKVSKLNVVSMPQKKLESQNILSQYNLIIYIIHLSNSLKNSKKVTKNMTLRSKNWSKSCYQTLSTIIEEDLENKLTLEQKRSMGTSISARTLQKIIENNYKLSYPIDPRTLNTLNKVVIFLEYHCWNDFVHKMDQEIEEKSNNENPKEKIIEIVKNAIRREYLMYSNLPKIDENFLSDTYIKNSSSYNMILDVLVDKSKKKQILSNPFNPSTCEILEIEVKKLEKNYAQVYTKEFWLLCWWDTSKKKYVKRYKVISDHFYVLNMINEKWMIKTNASTSDPLGLV